MRGFYMAAAAAASPQQQVSFVCCPDSLSMSPCGVTWREYFLRVCGALLTAKQRSSGYRTVASKQTAIVSVADTGIQDLVK